MKCIVCNVGWMERYAGVGHGDEITGGGSYIREHGMGHEVCNFFPFRGNVYGYVQPAGKHHRIAIERLGGSASDQVIEGALVVWAAKRPGGGSVVVGWYKNAEVYRTLQEYSTGFGVHKSNALDGFYFRAAESDARLLSIDERVLPVPRGRGGMGQANVWYPTASDAPEFMSSLYRLIAGRRIAISRKSRPRKTDPQHNARVERAAIAVVRRHYEGCGYTVESVERDNVGWDLEARAGRVVLKIEVKGLSADSARVQLSPNEYAAFCGLNDSYRLCVVTSALSQPHLFTCRYSAERSDWVINDQSAISLAVEKRMSAIVELKIV